MPVLSEPVGWWVINGSLYCDNHFKTTLDIIRTFELAALNR